MLASRFKSLGDFIGIAVGDAITTVRLKPDGYSVARLYTIASRKCLDEIRRQKKLLSTNDENIQNLLASLSDNDFLHHLHNKMEVETMLSTLSKKRREAISLHYFEGRSDEQIAKKLGISVNSVKDRIKFALKELRKNFGNHPK